MITTPTVTGQRIAFLSLFMSVALSVFLFAESRTDPSLRIAAFVSVTGVVNTLMAIGSMVLTGKDLTHKDTPDPASLPPGSTVQQSQSSSIQTPSAVSTSTDTTTLGK